MLCQGETLDDANKEAVVYRCSLWGKEIEIEVQYSIAS